MGRRVQVGASALLLAMAMAMVSAGARAPGSVTQQSEPAVDESNVFVLTIANFDALTAEGVWMVEFYAPWCGHCRNLKPTWAEFAMKAREANVNVGKVDTTVEKDLAKRFGIRSLPTIKLIRDGRLYDYNSHRTVDSFLSFAVTDYAKVEARDIPPTAESTPATTAAPKEPDQAVVQEQEEAAQEHEKEVVTLTSEDFDKYTQSGDWFVEFYAPWCGHCKRLAPIWEEFAKKADSPLNVAKVDCTVHSAVCNRLGIRGYPTIKLFQAGQPKDYSGPRTLEAFREFYQKAKDDESEKEAEDHKDEL